ncbi:2-oxoglutarate dehydrogenase complex dihydrolipoyllysine-residue succinyltransferase [Mucisphaera calidilacus]|uniref:Dihydrolipoyllysine-residue succinyltransferase component of 2-oxoglutarate dehydrogenase complex n=1 Tax=Mucisphaera calidilacus TaxID=2527982 RepID=A0A518BTH4_9BACT|nr:2-oxoglutarate dehydrogenase complex dihydrolipoyllysine-residue succinyltransferase [Mucisphaera calidilacus]QDU70273.1 Dihydrolipoyllysine-residue succinyltransferase component of 2-oxoglutarate dehydrogenase complex [Mucisphaera calidilacus]
MPVELIVPEVGESITEVEIGQWLKAEGEAVGKDDTLCEIETDKVTLELPAPADGVITKLLKKQGDRANVGDVIGYLEEGAEASASNGAEAKADDKPDAKPDTETPEQDTASDDDKPAKATSVMPAAQVLLEKHNLHAEAIRATGPGGKLLKQDVLKHLEQQGEDAPAKPEKQPEPKTDDTPEQQPARPAAVAAPEPVTDTAIVASPTPVTPGDMEEVVPMTPLRRRVAQHLKNAQNTAALLTTFNEVDMTAVMDLRKQYKEGFEKKHNVKLGFMSFFVKAAIDALRQFPAVNAEIRGTDIVYKNHYDIGIAVSAPKGLVVPVLRHAERMSFAEVEKGIGDFVDRIKTNQLRIEEMQGGTFTITNGGIFGSLISTPIVNAPQSAILGMHAIQQRPVAVDGKVEIRPMMYLALTYDHRLIDGREAVTFLVRLKETLEDPARMLIEA